MKYLILDGPSYPVSHRSASYLGTDASYRGTDRRRPLYCDALPEDHEINQLFAWYLEETESGFLHDLAKACRYAALCNLHFPGKSFEVVEVADGEAKPSNAARLLGFDISLGGGGDSLIFLVLLYGPAASLPKEPILLLSDLIRRYFCPKLNEFGLFRTFEDASHCRRAMIALQSFHPNHYEGGDLNLFTVTGVYLPPQSDNGSA
jgi:hypothetical protein